MTSCSTPLSVIFERNRDHGDLHSFPTRRSSDLEDFADDVRETAQVSLRVGAGREGKGQILVGQLDSARDRKSTRLNSSHSQISYAVFCLKKKKESHASGIQSTGLQDRRRCVLPS